MTDHVYLREVGLRDGLQMVKTILTTEQKLDWYRRAVSAGLSEIEVTSFVPPSVVPQFADARDVAVAAAATGGALPTALVPNLKGAEFAFASGLKKVNYVISASEAHNLANVGRTHKESLDGFADIIAHRNAVAPTAKAGSGIATAFGCTIAGTVPERAVFEIAERLMELGVDEIAVADTVGYANPNQVKRIMSGILGIAGDVPVACHFHDTRGLGLANVTAALDVGVRAFDTSLGGLGGCPFAPGATGNINTEDTAFLLESLGLHTGVDIEALITMHQQLKRWLPDEGMTGALARAGLPKTYQPILAAYNPQTEVAP